MSKVLITGGAGFIGSHLAHELLQSGHQVRVLDILSPQVHGPDGTGIHPNSDVELMVGDIRNPHDVKRAISGRDVVYHMASAIGIGQSMYNIAEYTSINCLGTAVLLEAIVANPIERLILTSSMTVYGEGLYRGRDGLTVHGAARRSEQFAQGHWNVLSEDGEELLPIATPEETPLAPASVYAQGKQCQEQLCQIASAAYRIPSVILRFFNVYGPRQSLANPYAGVLAVFAERYRRGNCPVLYEDGRQTRDFVHVRDVARACRMALESPHAVGEVLNIGSGRPVTIREAALELASVLGCEHLTADVTYRHRSGDVRHCFADISKARRVLGFEPRIPFRDGLNQIAEWLATQRGEAPVPDAAGELLERGLLL